MGRWTWEHITIGLICVLTLWVILGVNGLFSR